MKRMDFRTVKRGFNYVKRTRDFKAVKDYLDLTKNMSKIFGVDKKTISTLVEEFNNSGLIEHIDSKLGVMKNNPTGALLNPGEMRIIYATVRLVKPKIMIETGVSSGSTTSIILKAMEKNEIGKLFSIDLHPSSKESEEWIPDSKESGWIIPDELRSRWELHYGKTKDILKPLLDKFEEIDIFFHDSDHSYENMMYEFETSYPKLRNGGVILSDNASNLNSAFSDFASPITKNFKIITDCGILVKP